jgi:hypothetical protein
MAAKRAEATARRPLERDLVMDLARRTAEPAVTILMPVEQPAIAHEEVELRLRAMTQRAIDITRSWWSASTAEQVAAQLERRELRPDLGHERGDGVAILVTPEDGLLLHLPFRVAEQVAVDRTFATRQLFEGVAGNPRYRVLVLDGHRARLYEGQGHLLDEVEAHGFPVQVEPPHEQDTPHRDFPRHEEAETEEHRYVYRAVDAALEAANRSTPLPIVVAATERELALFEGATSHAGPLIGRLRGNYAHAGPVELSAAVRPQLDADRATRQGQIVERLRDALGRHGAASGLHAVKAAAEQGRGHLLVVEEGFTFPRRWVDGLAAGKGSDPQLDFDDVVDDVIESVLLAGGDVEFVEDGALSDCAHIGVLLRY